MTARATAKKHSIPNFEMHSVLLLAAFVVALGMGASVHAQESANLSTPALQPAALVAAAADAPIPANKTTPATLQAAFNRADGDRDGRLSRGEAEHFPMLSQHFEQFDGNHDTFLSREEFNTAAGL